MLPFTGGPAKARRGCCREQDGLPHVETQGPKKPPFLSPSALGDSIWDPKEDGIEQRGAVQVWAQPNNRAFFSPALPLPNGPFSPDTWSRGHSSVPVPEPLSPASERILRRLSPHPDSQPIERPFEPPLLGAVSMASVRWTEGGGKGLAAY